MSVTHSEQSTKSHSIKARNIINFINTTTIRCYVFRMSFIDAVYCYRWCRRSGSAWFWCIVGI